MKRAASVILVFFIAAFCCGCEGPPAEETTRAAAQTYEEERLESIAAQTNDSAISADFLMFCAERFGTEVIDELRLESEKGVYDKSFWYSRTGNSLNVLLDLFHGASAANYISLGQNDRKSFVISFAGDVNLADNWNLMRSCSAAAGGPVSCLSPELLAHMQSADIMVINNEFAFSDGGSPMTGKRYTFRAKTKNVSILKQMGVDAVCLANNHVYDFGTQAFHDTLHTLDAAGIKRFGAGSNAQEAQQPLYYVINGIKVALIGATRAEKNVMTPGAGEETPGVFRAYDDSALIETIKRANEISDIVLVMLHWGTEFTTVLEPVQISLGKKCVEAGANVVIGAHPHVLQGFSSHKGSLIAYSLGNFWFNDETVDTGLLNLEIFSPDRIDASFTPCLQKDCKTSMLTDETEKQRVLKHLTALSTGVSFDERGNIKFYSGDSN